MGRYSRFESTNALCESTNSTNHHYLLGYSIVLIREFAFIRRFESVIFMITTEKILLEYDPEVRNLLPVLKKISAAFSYVSQQDAAKVADYFSLPLARVYETASFYDLLSTKKEPALVIKVCSGTHCAVNDSFYIISEIENLFHIKANEEANQRVKLEIISCLGRCGEGPIVIVNDKVYERVTPSAVHGILKGYL